MLNITASSQDQSREDREARRIGWFALASGLNTALAVSYILCKPPSRTLSLTARLVTPVIYIAVASLAGVFGTWLLVPTGASAQLRALSRIGLRGWLFLPAIALFLHQGSLLATFIAIAVTIPIAIGIQRLTAAAPNPIPAPPNPQSIPFTTEIQISPSSWLPLALSVILYTALAAAAQNEIALLTLLMVIWTLVVTIQIKAVQPATSPRQPATNPRPYALIAAAFICIFFSLSLSTDVWHERYLGWSGIHPAGPKNPIATPSGTSKGYQTIVLWPLKKPEKVIPSPPLSIDPSSLGGGKPWVIPFYGPYWYFKFPGETPGPNAQTTHADPLKASVRSTDRAPLLMDAHQYLATPIDLACCREIQVVFRNDVSLGALAVALSLTDSQTKKTQSLGAKLITDTPQPTATPSSVEQTLSFPIPESALIKSFDAITVTLVANPSHATMGRKVAIERFVMIPN